MSDDRATHRVVRVVLGLGLLAAVVGLLLSGVHESVSPSEIRARLLESGAWGPVVFVLAFAGLQPLGVAAHVFVIAASLVWGPAMGFLLAWAGAVAAGCVAFWFSRYMGREWVQKKLPERLVRYDELLARRGFRTVLVMRLLFFTFGPMQLMLGVSRVAFVPFLLGSILGLAPMIALESWVGSGVITWLFS